MTPSEQTRNGVATSSRRVRCMGLLLPTCRILEMRCRSLVLPPNLPSPIALPNQSQSQGRRANKLPQFQSRKKLRIPLLLLQPMRNESERGKRLWPEPLRYDNSSRPCRTYLTASLHPRGRSLYSITCRIQSVRSSRLLQPPMKVPEMRCQHLLRNL